MRENLSPALSAYRRNVEPSGDEGQRKKNKNNEGELIAYSCDLVSFGVRVPDGGFRDLG